LCSPQEEGKERGRAVRSREIAPYEGGLRKSIFGGKTRKKKSPQTNQDSCGLKKKLVPASSHRQRRGQAVPFKGEGKRGTF